MISHIKLETTSFSKGCCFAEKGIPQYPAPWPTTGDRALLEFPSDLSPGRATPATHPAVCWPGEAPLSMAIPRLVFGFTIKPWMGKVLQVFGIFVVAVLTVRVSMRWTCGLSSGLCTYSKNVKWFDNGVETLGPQAEEIPRLDEPTIPVHICPLTVTNLSGPGPVWRLTIFAHLPPTGAAAAGLNLSRTSHQGTIQEQCESSEPEMFNV